MPPTPLCTTGRAARGALLGAALLTGLPAAAGALSIAIASTPGLAPFAVVPEPAAAAPLALGLIGLGRAGRRRDAPALSRREGGGASAPPRSAPPARAR